jgi:glycosyltransferase involved in cell wall biosynthesis
MKPGEETKPKVWIQCPCYNEELNIPVLYERFKAVADNNKEYDFHLLFVDDHSKDNTPAVVRGLSKNDGRVSGIRLASNVGSHAACSAGFQHADGDCVIAMSSDLQDPPEIIPAMLEKWKAGVKVVWAARKTHKRGNILAGILPGLYWFIMRKYILPESHPRGADFFLADRQVVEVISRITERNRSVLALISSIGFTQDTILYDKQKRLHGKSKWKFSKKIKFTIDSILGYTHLPVRIMSLVGIVISIISFIYGINVFINYFSGTPIPGWSSVMLVVLLIGGFQMTMLGIIGEYIWRILDEVRGRPYFVVEDKINL